MLKHPYYFSMYQDWEKWRYTYEGGRAFVERYLKTFSNRESKEDFKNRKEMTYCPAFAKAAINDIKNSIFQRITDVTREGGPVSYTNAMKGLNGGVDGAGSSMNSFIGRVILPELLVMNKVGICVDRERINNPTLATPVTPPYIYAYTAENITSWAYRGKQLVAVQVEECIDEFDDKTGLVIGSKTQHKKMWLNREGTVSVQYFDEQSKAGDIIELKLTKLPFVILELTNSLLADVADYQIALLNIESSDNNYIMKSNFPFYTEQRDIMRQGSHLKQGDEGSATNDEIDVGATQGRAYGKGLERPDFIAPPTEPIMASMKKVEAIKDDIRKLVNLALSSVKSVSAESKKIDEHGLEAGLSYIGLELEHGERKIAEIWAEYEGTDVVPTVKYPERYSLKSDKEILDECKELEDRMKGIPSPTYKKVIAKQIATKMIGPYVSREILNKINEEIDSAKMLTTDPETIFSAVENTLLGSEDAAKALGFPEGTIERAKQDHADRAARILEAQQKVANASRGVNDLSDSTKGADDKAAVREKSQAKVGKGDDRQ
jgi:hypothetical protein